MSRISAALIIQNSRAGDIDANLSKTMTFACSAAGRGADIVVFPEMNLTGYLTGKEILSISRNVSAGITGPFVNLSQDLGITLITGLAEQTDTGQIFATQVVFFPNGTYRFFRKIHTAPFEKQYFTAGSEIPVFESHAITFGVQLCYDAHFPELSLAMALKGADVIFIPHASPRGTCREKFESWLRHLTARAFDNGVYIAACNQSGDNGKGLVFPGISLLIGPDGKVISSRLDGKEGIHLVSVDLDRLAKIRSHPMRYFLPNRRKDLFPLD